MHCYLYYLIFVLGDLLFLGLVSGSKESLTEAVSDALGEIGMIAEGKWLLSGYGFTGRWRDGWMDGVKVRCDGRKSERVGWGG